VCVLPTSAESEQSSQMLIRQTRETGRQAARAEKEFGRAVGDEMGELLQMRSSINVSYKATLLYYNCCKKQSPAMCRLIR